MSNFWNIMKFELRTYLTRKSFVILTVCLVLVMGAVLFYPRISAGFAAQGDEAAPPPEERTTLALQDAANLGQRETLISLFGAGFADQNIAYLDPELSLEEIKAQVASGEYAGAIVLLSPTEYRYVVDDLGMYDATTSIADELMTQFYRQSALTQLGLTPEQAQSVLNVQITNETIQTGKNQMSSFFYTYILIFALYFAILMYGQFVATSVATEKSSRAMEVLITAARPTQLMFGKVIGSGLAGLLQMTLILGSGFVFYQLNQSFWADNMIVTSIFGMPLSILLYTILFFVLGFFIYAFMYGALGSLATRTEDINTLTLPVTFLFIIAFFVTMFSMGTGAVDNPLMVACSYIPFTSPMAMFTRIAMGSVPPGEIIASIAILLVSTVAIGYLAAGIYRMGVLLYGNPPKPREILRLLRQNMKKA